MDISQKKIEQFIQGKNIPVCPLCLQNEWNMSSKVFQLLEFDTSGLTLGGPTYPVLPITCSHCGNTLFINALIAGLIDQVNDNTKK